jgi:hypothetical protein
LTLDFEKSLMFDGKRMRYVAEGPFHAVSDARDLSPRQLISVFDGEESKVYWPPRTTHGNGFILSQKSNRESRHVSAKPVLFTYRPVDKSMGGFTAEDYSVGSSTAVVGEHFCIVLETAPTERRDKVVSLCVDPDSDFVIRRHTISNAGQVVQQTDVSYSFEAANGWVPSTWKTTWFSDGRIVDSTVCTLTRHFFNMPSNIKSFRVTFAPGTLVADERSRIDYIVRADGSRRIILPGEEALSYDELLNTVSGRAGVGRAPNWWAWLLVLVCGSSVLVWSVRKLLRRRVGARDALSFWQREGR